MNKLLSLNSPLQSIFWPKDNIMIKETLLIIGGVLLLAFSSHLSIPLKPVPLTFQSATVIFVGMAFGARLSTYTLLAYLSAGICGLPVFSDAATESGFLFGPTFGYIIGFLPAAALSGYLTQKGWAKNMISSFAAASIGAGIIFVCGVTELSLFIGWRNAIMFGLMPFIISEPVKLLAAACVVPRLWKNRKGD